MRMTLTGEWQQIIPGYEARALATTPDAIEIDVRVTDTPLNIRPVDPENGIGVTRGRALRASNRLGNSGPGGAPE